MTREHPCEPKYTVAAPVARTQPDMAALWKPFNVAAISAHANRCCLHSKMLTHCLTYVCCMPSP